jgi:hypothetical protein
MGKKEASSSANFKKAALSLLENKGQWKNVPASLKGAFTCRVHCDNPQFIVSDETHFIGAYLTPEAFAKYSSKFKSNHISASEGTFF